MIELFDDWVILIGDSDYQLAKPAGTRTDKRTGEKRQTYKVYGYFGTITAALNRLMQECTREKLKDRTTSLYEALQAFREARGKLAEILGVVEDSEP